MSAGRRLVLALAIVLPAVSDTGPAQTPEVALAALEPEEGLVVELVACEPDVVDPIALAFDEEGRLFVVEGRGYPTDEHRGMIALLHDEDGDGRYSRRATFVEGLRFPTGVLPWRGGLIVTDAPNVLWLVDEDGDGRSDRSEMILTGFSTALSTQLRVNDPTLAPDGKVYLAGGLAGGEVRSAIDPSAPAIDTTRSDLRFDPLSGACEAVDGKSQYGLSLDDFGRRFICMNRVQARHVVVESARLARHPRLAVPRTVEDLPVERVDDLLRGENRAARIHPLSSNRTTADSHAGTFSAACAVLVWRGGELPEAWTGQILSCDPTGNLVHRDEVSPRGATFLAHRPPGTTELLASRLDSFRPVFLAEAPDGALWICDMSREVIEHPDYLPPEVRKRTDFSAGRDQGRIWRVRSATASRAKRRAAGTIVDGLRSPLPWHRDAAMRAVLESRDGPAIEHTREALARSERPETSALCLRLLDHLDAVFEDEILAGLGHPHAGVREVALRAAERRVHTSQLLAHAVRARARDDDARVRFTAALVLAGDRDAGSVERLVAIARAGLDDPWARLAVLAACEGREVPLLAGVLEAQTEPDGETSAGLDALLAEGARCAGPRAADALRALVGRLAGADGPGPRQAIALLDGHLAAPQRAPSDWLDASSHRRLALEARRLTTAPALDPTTRRRAIRILRALAPSDASATLVELIESRPPEEVAVEAARALGRLPRDEGVGARLAERLPALRAAVADALIGALCPDPGFAAVCLDLLESGEVAIGALSPSARRGLERHADASIRERASRIWTSANADRRAVHESLARAAELPGDPRAGKELFASLCAPCHRLDGAGTAVGPDLYGSRSQDKATILLHVLVPNHEIAPGFDAWLAITASGEAVTGLLVAETRTTVTLRARGGEERVLERSSLTRLGPSPISLMPDGLEAGLDAARLADLLAYVRGE